MGISELRLEKVICVCVCAQLFIAVSLNKVIGHGLSGLLFHSEPHTTVF